MFGKFGHRHGFSRFSPATAFSQRAMMGLVMLSAMVLASSNADAQPDEPETPYVGTIDFDTVEARSGAGRVFYPVAEMKKGDRVMVVDDDFFTWFRVSVPQTVTATVRQADVEAKGDGSKGVVIADIATVNVLGTGRNAAESFKSLKTLSKGQSVTIKGRDGDYFLIAPPKDALIFLPPGSVKPLQDQPEFDATEGDPQPQAVEQATPEAESATATTEVVTPPTRNATAAVGRPGDMVPIDAQPEPATATTETPTVETATPTNADTDPNANGPAPITLVDPRAGEPTPDTDTDPASNASSDTTVATGDPASPTTATPDADAGEIAVAVEPVPVETPAVNAALRAVELAMLPHFAKPVDRQPLAEIEAAYRKVAAENELVGVDKRIIDSRLAAVQRNKQFAAAMAQIQQRQAAVPKVEPVQVEPDANEPWAAIGVLSVSSVLGEQVTYRVIDPATRRTIAYLKPAAGIDPALNLGQIVGIKGPRQYDQSLNHQLIIAQQIRVLDTGE